MGLNCYSDIVFPCILTMVLRGKARCKAVQSAFILQCGPLGKLYQQQISIELLHILSCVMHANLTAY